VHIRRRTAQEPFNAVHLNLTEHIAHRTEPSHLRLDLQNESLHHRTFVGVFGVEKSNHWGFLLAVAVYASVPLLHLVGIPRQFEMNEVVTVFLKIESLAGHVRGNQNA